MIVPIRPDPGSLTADELAAVAAACRAIQKIGPEITRVAQLAKAALGPLDRAKALGHLDCGTEQLLDLLGTARQLFDDVLCRT